MPLPSLSNVSDIRKVSALTAVRAQMDAGRHRGDADPFFPREEEKRIRACSDRPNAGSCPVHPAVYHDLTGDGRDELIVGIERGTAF
ncbi:hypothetical protein [Streptomyces sp. NPDC052496]|uniref:hypothetical protein n=1 Tax=Streptomyces sp. NPDC052496 TaxID=3154951 RepID=UPI00343389D5